MKQHISKTIGVILALLLISGIAYASTVTNGLGVGWLTGDIANATIGDLSVSSLISSLQDNSTGVINAANYATIQEAMNAMDADSDGDADVELYIPSGNYNLSNIIQFDIADQNVTIRGAGIDKTVIYGLTTDGYSGIRTYPNYVVGNYENWKNIEIRDLTFVQRNNYAGLDLANVNNVIIENTKWVGKPSGGGQLFQITSAKNVSVRNTIFIDSAGDGIIFSAVKFGDVTGNKIYNSSDDAITIDQPFQSDLANQTTGSDSVIVSNNLIDTVFLGHGVRVEGSTNVSVFGNTISKSKGIVVNMANGDDGDALLTTQDISIYGNTVSSCNAGTSGIFLGSIQPNTGTVNNTYVYGNTLVGDVCRIITVNASTTNNVTVRDNFGAAPFNHGNAAIAPTAFGEGDTYYNTTDNIGYKHNGTSWLPDTQTVLKEQFVGNGATKNFSTTYNILTNSTYLKIYDASGLNGYDLLEGTSYNATSYSVNLTTAPGNGLPLLVEYVKN